MPNLIHELIVELARVQALLPGLNAPEFQQAQRMLRYGRDSMALNQYEDMREALDDLKEFGKAK